MLQQGWLLVRHWPCQVRDGVEDIDFFHHLHAETWALITWAWLDSTYSNLFSQPGMARCPQQQLSATIGLFRGAQHIKQPEGSLFGSEEVADLGDDSAMAHCLCALAQPGPNQLKPCRRAGPVTNTLARFMVAPGRMCSRTVRRIFSGWTPWTSKKSIPDS